MYFHGFCRHRAKHICPCKRTPTLDSDLRKCVSLSRQTLEKGFRAETSGGLFLLCSMLLCCCLPALRAGPVIRARGIAFEKGRELLHHIIGKALMGDPVDDDPAGVTLINHLGDDVA